MEQLPTGAFEPLRYHECPHCHHEVMVRADGHCIACGKNCLDKAGQNPELTMLAIDNIHRLPACCFVCGVDTERRQRLSWTYRVDTFRLPFWCAPMVALFSYLPGSEYRQRFEMNLPVCPHCAAKARKSRPLSARAGLDCRLLVHRNFRRQFEILNGRERMEWERDINVGNAPSPTYVPVPTIKIL